MLHLLNSIGCKALSLIGDEMLSMIVDMKHNFKKDIKSIIYPVFILCIATFFEKKSINIIYPKKAVLITIFTN